MLFSNKLARKPALLPTADVLTSYTGEQLKVLGTANLKVQYKNQTPQTHTFHVVCTDRAPILSRQTSERLQLIKFVLSISNPAPIRPVIQKLLNEFSDVFEGIGTLPGTCKIYLKEGAIPTIQPPKRVPFALQAMFKEELDRLELLGVIEKVTKPTQWVNSLVLVRKADGSLRICLDPVDLNRAIERPHYPIPLFDEVAAKCKGAKKFFKMDARNGYWSMVLDKPSSELTTFNTMYGQYKWNQYPFGLISAQDEYQRKMEEVFTDLDIGRIVDDIAGIGCIDAEHDAKLRAVLQAARDKGEELQTLLGMYNYLSRYIPNLATLNKPLRDLSKQQKFEWNTSHKEAKRVIQNPVSKNLSYFDPEAKEIEVITDASQHGLGAQLTTDGATVAFASRSLSETEQHYSQMEKEMLAVTFACKRFHQYLFGRTICVTTDHKPLESFFGKSIQRAPPRLQRMVLAIQPYDIKLRYKPGKTIPVVDTLSRLHLADTDIESQVDMEILREKAQEAQSKHYNHHARNMEPLKTGQKVWVQLTDQGTWKKATVCKTGDSPRSYYVRFEEGGMFRRNRIHIKSRQDPMVTDLHDGASCQVKTSSVSPSKKVLDSLADSQETTDPPLQWSLQHQSKVSQTKSNGVFQASENRCSQKDIGEVAGTAEATIRQAYRLMLSSASLLFPADFKFAIPIKDLPQTLPNSVQRAAHHIANKAGELDIVQGRSPISVAAAAIYMASQASENRCSQKDIGEVAGTAEATIRQVYRLMLPSASLLFPADFKFAIPIKDLPQS
ncbi:hypothetical protein QYM36_005932 [Artemia franciscana]|uniref:General transcription factor TFIIB n=1 Tax=Artemia franciscana TaxID=6661 RepID=A0AA88I0L3_ARTSF|nr:hypothetical protein QYM36_005932 [Artemia franciscana]